LRDVEWLRSSAEVLARIRYKSPAAPATLMIDDDFESTRRIRLQFADPVWGVTPGQSVVLYKDGLVIGGGLIES
jgi:tRNA-specific 2-thiouridylase